MKLRKTPAVTLAIPLVIFTLQAAVSFADSWRMPTEDTVDSPNGQYSVTIYPRSLESQLKYFEEQVEGQSPETAGAPEALEEHEIRGPSATFIDRSRGSEAARRFSLLNPVAPVSALVADSGRFLVTFDNWHSIGWGDHVVAIYRTDGGPVRSFSLEELLTEGDLEVLPRSVSSRYWSGDHRIDEAKNELVLEITDCGYRSRCDSDPVLLRIDLLTGEPLEPKRDLLPQPRPEVSIVSIQGDFEAREAGKSRCEAGASVGDHAETARAPLDAVVALSLEPPEFSTRAFKAGITGKIVLEVLVAPDGHVACASVLKSLPMGLDEKAMESALRWKFEAAPLGARLLAAIEFRIARSRGGRSVFRSLR